MTAAFAILPLLLISLPEITKRSETSVSEGVPTFWEDFRSGLRYVWSWPGLMLLLVLAMVINFLLTPAGTLMPILVFDYFGGGALQLGWIEAAFGFGMVAGGLVLGAWGGFKKRILTSMFGLIGLGIGFSLLGFVPSDVFWLAILSAFFAAFMISMVNGPVHAILQATLEPDMQGRVFTLMGSLSAGMAPLGLIIAGPVADAIGVQSWYVVAGIAAILMAVLGLSLPAVMNIEDNHRKAGEPVQEQVETAGSEVLPT